MRQIKGQAFILWLCMSFISGSVVAQNRTTDPATGVVTWETTAHGVTLSLTQMLPDQARAFYLNRGLSAEATEAYAKACVYSVVLRNDTASGVVHFRLADWSVVSEGKSKPLPSVEGWLSRFEEYEHPKSATIAFRWAQFPPQQAYQPGGDWNQGMIATGLPAGSEFDLVARWEVAGQPYQGVLNNVRCAR